MIYHIGIYDTGALVRENLEKMLNRIALNNQLQVRIHTFSTLSQLANYLIDPGSEPLYTLIIDINVKEKKNGLEFSRQLRQEGNKTPIIFTSDSQRFVLEGYTVEPKGYLIKPVKEKELEEAFLRIINGAGNNQIILRSPTRSLAIDLDRITYLEVMNNESIIHYANPEKTDHFRIPLKRIKKMLPECQFFQTHRSYIVSLPAIHAINKREIILLNNEHIPVSWHYYNALQEKLLNWFMGH